jgi:hypothetical protein
MHSDILKAQDKFQAIMREVGIDKLKIKDEEGREVTGVNLQAMALPDMWLPRLMMRTDDVSALLTGERAFECGYKYNKKTLTGIIPHEINEIEAKEYGYSTKILGDDKLIKLIMKHSLMTSVSNLNGYAQLNQFETYHLSDKSDLFVRPMQEELLVASLLRDFTKRAAPMIELALNRANDPEMKI